MTGLQAPIPRAGGRWLDSRYLRHSLVRCFGVWPTGYLMTWTMNGKVRGLLQGREPVGEAFKDGPYGQDPPADVGKHLISGIESPESDRE